jgi:hypothetical protein
MSNRKTEDFLGRGSRILAGRLRTGFDKRGVSMLVEYLILVSVISIFVFLLSMSLNQKLEESQIDTVVENQFSDIASQISSQLVDMLSVYPRNGKLEAKVFMPKSIGDVEYTVALRNQYVTIVSEFGKHNKSLSLGAAALLKFQLIGATHSLEETHGLNYTKISPTYPSAVLILEPTAVYANETTPGHFVIDVSRSSAMGAFIWRVVLWNGTELTGNSGDTQRDIYVYWDTTEFSTYCNYNATAETAECNITLTVTDLRGLSDTDEATILIAKSPTTPPSLYIKKFVSPPQTVPGKPVELHIYLNGRGFRTEGTALNLSTVVVIDTSGSMGDLSIARNIYDVRDELSTYYGIFRGNVTPAVWRVVYDINSTFRNKAMRVVAYTTDPMNPWWSGYDRDDAITLYIYQADGDSYTAIRELNTAGYYGKVFDDSRITPTELGEWVFEVVAANPDPIILHLELYKCTGIYWGGWCIWGSWQLMKSFTTTYFPNYGETTIELKPGYTQDDEYVFLLAEMDDKYKDDFITWYDQQMCVYGGVNGLCFDTDVDAGQKSFIVVPRFLGAVQYEGMVYIQKLDSTKIASIDFINDGLGTKDLVGLVHFSTYAYKHVVNTSPYLSYLTTNKLNVVNEIKLLSASGATNIYQALAYARDELLENTTIISGTKPLIVFMTDGQPTVMYDESCGDYTNPSCYIVYGSYCVPECYSQIENLASNIKGTQIGGENITICTIGFGTAYNATLLSNIASYKPGSTEKCFYEAKDYYELVEAFTDISRIFKLAAKNVTITDVIPPDLDVEGVKVEITGNAVCDSPTIGKIGTNTSVQLNCSEIYIDDDIELIVTLRADQPGTYYLDIPKISNVTYEGYPFGPANIEVFPLKVVTVRYGGAEKATVRIS